MFRFLSYLILFCLALNCGAQNDSLKTPKAKRLIYTITLAPSYCWRDYTADDVRYYYGNGKAEDDKPSLGSRVSFTIGKKLRKVELHFGVGMIQSSYKRQFSREINGFMHNGDYTFTHLFLNLPSSISHSFGQTKRGYTAIDIELSYLFYYEVGGLRYKKKQPALWLGGDLGYALISNEHFKLISSFSLKCSSPIWKKTAYDDTEPSSRTKFLIDSSINLKFVF